jgi:hypothetical protein
MGISKAGSGGIDPTLTQVRGLAVTEVSKDYLSCLALLLGCLHNCASALPLQEMVEVAQKLGPSIIRQLDHYISANAASVTS